MSSIAYVYVDEQKTEQTKTSNAAGYARSRSAQRDQMTEATRRTDMSDKGIAEERNILRTGSVNSATKVKTFETPLGLNQNAQQAIRLKGRHCRGSASMFILFDEL